MLREGSASTLKGITVSIGASTVLCILFGPYQITPEMMGRTQPNLLDLIVVVASGAAGAYAVSRKSVAAALPGVAISAALVPPLCVVGYGLATSRFPVSGGALLLFLTNLSAIILSSALIFLLVGFRPNISKSGRQLRRVVILFALTLMLLAIPLGFQTKKAAQIETIEIYIANRIAEAAKQTDARLQNLTIKKTAGHYFIDVVVVLAEEPKDIDLQSTKKEIEKRVNMPVEIHLTIIPGKVYKTDRASNPG